MFVSAARHAALADALAQEKVRRVLAEDALYTLVRSLGTNAAEAVARGRTLDPAPHAAADVQPEETLDAITDAVRAECERWSGGSPKQRAANLRFCYDLARKGKDEAAIIAALRRGETT